MKKETKLSIALHIVAMIILAAFMWALADYKAALISLLVYVTCAAIREMGKQEGQREMREKCLENFIEGAAKVVKDTDLAMKALGIDEETQEKIRRAREIVHKAHCADLPVPDKIVIRKETEPQPPSFKESQGESGTNKAYRMTDLMQEYIERGMHELAKKEREGIEYILRNLIDNPITGDITIEKLMERNIISFVYDKHLPPTKIEEQGNKMVFTMHSDFFGIRQGAYIVRPNGERVEIDYQVLANTRQDFIDYSRQGT